MMSEYCEGIDKCLYKNKNGEMKELLFMDDNISDYYFTKDRCFILKNHKKVSFKITNIFKKGWVYGFVGNDYQKTAYRLNIYKKIKYIPIKK